MFEMLKKFEGFEGFEGFEASPFETKFEMFEASRLKCWKS